MQKTKAKAPQISLKIRKKEVQKKAQQTIRNNPDHTVIAQDEASFIIGWNTQNSWYPVGRPVYTHVSLSRERFHAFGGLHKNGFDCRFYDKANAYNFIDFLGHMHHKHGKIIVFVDNAMYHKSKMVKKFVEQYKGDIMLEYLPPYTPELNPTESQWKLLRRATGNAPWKNTDALKKAMWGMFEKCEVKIAKLSDYLS